MADGISFGKIAISENAIDDGNVSARCVVLIAEITAAKYGYVHRRKITGANDAHFGFLSLFRLWSWAASDTEIAVDVVP